MDEVRRVLVVDAEPAAVADLIGGRQALAGCALTLAASPPEAMALLGRQSFPVLLADLGMPGAADLIEHAAQSLPHTVVLGLASQAAPAGLIIDALSRGVHKCLPRESPERVSEAVAAALAEAARRRERDQHSLQAERLATMGSMISGIAHELNNKLAPVVACAELLEGSHLGLKDRQRVQLITTSAFEAKRIVEGLLNFARQERPRPRALDVNAAVRRLLSLPTYRFRQWRIEVATELAPDLPQTMADPDQIDRVLVNLVNNACQAMEGTGGRLRLATGRRPGRLVIEVEDSGPGIAPENLPRIFDPFFSTKGLGKGTGLGLSLCHGIVREHGGAIEVESCPGRTVFRVLLPLVAPSGEQQVVRRPAPPLRPRLGGRLLLVDDEDNILRVLRDALGESFEVVCAANGREAVGQLAQAAFDAVVTDIKMPQMDGMQLYGWIESNRPELARRVIFTTGNTIDAETGAFLKGCRNPYLTKPFNLSRLLATLENVLD